MSLPRRAARFRVIVLLVFGWACAGCYKPSIQDGGLRCANADVCPEGFHCAPDGTCHKGPKMVCQSSSPHVAPLPMCTPMPGADCDPICQSRCECGRCNLMGTSLTCVPPGTKKRGELCNAASDDCAPGNVCVNYCGGDKGARCYRFCGKGQTIDEDQCEGTYCDITLNPGGQTEWLVCEPPLAACNPIGDNNDCPEPTVLGCYVGPNGGPVCDCRGTSPEGGPCGPYNSCVPGFSCVQLQGGVATCVRACRRNGSDCPSGTFCSMLPGNIDYGYCRS